VRHKFLGIGEPGYHPLRKIRTVFSGLRYAVLYDWSVTYKLVISSLVLIGAFSLRAWVDFLLILVVTAFVVFAEIMNSAIEALCDFVEARHNAIFAWLTVITVEFGRFISS
jgi:diacylglycerol kinase